MLFRKQLNSLRERLQYANSSYYGAVMRASTGSQPFIPGYASHQAGLNPPGTSASVEELMRQYESSRQAVAASLQ